MFGETGTGNGMAKSVLDLSGEACDAATATFAIIRGHKQALDVAAVVQGQVTYHSILMLSWGFVADVDFESERYRWMGRFRLDIQVYTFGLSLLVMSNINVDNGY
jgi:sphingosine kinase